MDMAQKRHCHEVRQQNSQVKCHDALLQWVCNKSDGDSFAIGGKAAEPGFFHAYQFLRRVREDIDALDFLKEISP